MIVEISFLPSLWIILEKKCRLQKISCQQPNIDLSIYINKKSLTVSAPSDIFTSEKLQTFSKNVARFNINHHDFHGNLIFVTNSKCTILSIRWILMRNDWTTMSFIGIENNSWIIILQRFYSLENPTKRKKEHYLWGRKVNKNSYHSRFIADWLWKVAMYVENVSIHILNIRIQFIIYWIEKYFSNFRPIIMLWIYFKVFG